MSVNDDVFPNDLNEWAPFKTWLDGVVGIEDSRTTSMPVVSEHVDDFAIDGSVLQHVASEAAAQAWLRRRLQTRLHPCLTTS